MVWSDRDRQGKFHEDMWRAWFREQFQSSSNSLKLSGNSWKLSVSFSPENIQERDRRADGFSVPSIRWCHCSGKSRKCSASASGAHSRARAASGILCAKDHGEHGGADKHGAQIKEKTEDVFQALIQDRGPELPKECAVVGSGTP